MPIKDILLHLDATPASRARLDFAAELAVRHSAHLFGLHVVDIALPLAAAGDFGGGAALLELFAQLQADAQAAAKPVAAGFHDTLRRTGLSGEWRLVEGSLPGQLALQGRYVDLVVMGQADPTSPDPAVRAGIEAALFETGRPVLLLPHAATPRRPGRHALLAWNARREAARALHDALPLLAAMEEVTVLTVTPDEAANDRDARSGADVATHLVRHGLRAGARSVAAGGLAVSEVLLNEAADVGADLLVMGAYGHSRLREFVLGGVTRTLLRQMTLPILMSH